ncbi:uncharacterized protein LOC141905762 [Tubulanus polymorphus]|uniref:uncharacterized protein LOC141905762 n=1 Tax=Tubulanus polymorphus TaxID=672921 RepID=UPI003DA566E0
MRASKTTDTSSYLKMQLFVIILLAIGIISLTTGSPVTPRDTEDEYMKEDRECIICAKWCQFGFVPGPGGCPLCKCRPPPIIITGYGSKLARGVVCKELACEYECLSGYKKDELGCPMCQCTLENEQNILEQMLLNDEPNPL